MAVLWVTKKSNPTCIFFELKLVLFFDKLNPNFTGNQNICIATVDMTLATKTSNPTGTMFKFKMFVFG